MPFTVIAQTVRSVVRDKGPSQGLPGIDTIILDAVVREVHTLSAQPVDHPVEPEGDGEAIVSDHVVLEPETVQLDCWVTNTPVEDPPSHANGAVAKPIIVTPFNSLANNPGEVISNRLGAGDFTMGLTGVSMWPPPVGVSHGFTPEFDRALNVWEELRRIHKSRKLVSIVTTLQIYDSMLLTNISPTRTAQNANSLEFTVTARRMRVVNAAEVAAPTSAPVTKVKGAKAPTPAKPADAEVGESAAFKLKHAWFGP